MRLTSDMWVSAYLTRLRLVDIPAFVVKRGDATAGAVLVKVNTLDGQAALFQRGFNWESGESEWRELSSGPEQDIDISIGNQKRFDSDLWVIEVEDRFGRSLLDDPSLA